MQFPVSKKKNSDLEKAMQLTAEYKNLREQVESVLVDGRVQAEALVDSVKAHTYWRAGRLIEQHIKKEQPEAKRAEYGKHVIQKLGQDLGTNPTAVYYWWQFARTYPIFPALGKLGWTHFRTLLEVENPAQRKKLEEQASKEKWTTRQLEEKVDEILSQNPATRNNQREPKATRFISKKGLLHTYRMDKEDKVDLGFSSFMRADLKSLVGCKEGDILKFGNGKFIKLKDASRADIYTYKAYVERVVDADTLWLHIELGFKISVRQKVRLRGLDSPEISTEVGEKAKRFVEAQMRKIPFVIVKTTKPDKFDRYLSDIWLSEAEDAVSLNKLLIERGYARLVSYLPENHWDVSNTGRY